MDYSEYLIHKPFVKYFFDQATNTVSYVVVDETTKECAIIDSVLDYEPHSGRISNTSADAILAYIHKENLSVSWILETHVHADHLTASQYLKEKTGGKIAMSEAIVDVQKVFGDVFFEDAIFKRDGSQFDKLFAKDETFMIGTLPAQALYVPGHTPADVAYVIGDAVFVGDTIFMPDYGSARCDFPGGSAETLYASIEKLYTLPSAMRLFVCHDYLPESRKEYMVETTIGEEQEKNIHLAKHISKEDFVALRTLHKKNRPDARCNDG
jgi:glyoxylase-like metal-dependent hydrolase (beta-lactamase superfamily II)